jgi:hypothetical protein
MSLAGYRRYIGTLTICSCYMRADAIRFHHALDIEVPRKYPPSHLKCLVYTIMYHVPRTGGQCTVLRT